MHTHVKHVYVVVVRDSLHCLGDGAYLMTLIEEAWEDDLDIMAEKIAAVAHEVRHGEDDITVTLVRVAELESDEQNKEKTA